MTTRNLIKSFFATLMAQYREDLAAGSPHPIRYIRFDRKLNTDMFYEIAKPVDIPTFRAALRQYMVERGMNTQYENEVIKAYARTRLEPSPPLPDEDDDDVAENGDQVNNNNM